MDEVPGRNVTGLACSPRLARHSLASDQEHWARSTFSGKSRRTGWAFTVADTSCVSVPWEEAWPWPAGLLNTEGMG